VSSRRKEEEEEEEERERERERETEGEGEEASREGRHRGPISILREDLRPFCAIGPSTWFLLCVCVSYPTYVYEMLASREIDSFVWNDTRQDVCFSLNGAVIIARLDNAVYHEIGLFVISRYLAHCMRRVVSRHGDVT